MHFERNNWQFKPIWKKMENSVSKVIHGTRGFAYRRPNKKSEIVTQKNVIVHIFKRGKRGEVDVCRCLL